MKKPGSEDDFRGQRIRRVVELGIAPPQDRTLADAFDQNDHGHLRLSAFDDTNVFDIQIFRAQARQLSAAIVVVSHRTDVARSQPKAAAGHQCRCHLATGLNLHFFDLHFRKRLRKTLDHADRIQGIRP